MERVLILTGDAGEELEVYYMLYRLREAGYEVDVAAPERKRLQLVVHDFEPGWDTYVERPGRGLEADLAFAEVDPERYVGVLIPGGRAPEASATIPTSSGSSRTSSRTIWRSATCPRRPGAGRRGLCAWTKCSAYPPLAPDIEAAGGEFVDGPDVVDGMMVSARGWEDLAEFFKAFLELLERSAVPAQST